MQKNLTQVWGCRMCFSSRSCPDSGLNDNNDFSAIIVGKSFTGNHRFVLCSGAKSAVHLELDIYDASLGEWLTRAKYYPNYCPNCGRKLSEYRVDERGTGFSEHVFESEGDINV